MPDQPKMELFMQFVQRDGAGPVLAECAADKQPGDDFMTKFIPADYDNYSNFFEIQKFQFAVQVKDQDQTKKTTQTKDPNAAPKEKSAKLEGAFASWRSAKEDQVASLQYPFEPGQFSFTRLIDRASPIFAKCCCNSESFESATLVKRVAVGDNAVATSFLQFIFTDVLIVGLDWDDGDMTTESCKFICRGFEVRYRQQAFDGSLSKETSHASWDQDDDALPNGGKE